MYKQLRSQFKPKAITLRKQGWSYKEIRQEVPVSKSTLSLWLKDIPLSSTQRERLYTKQVSILARGSQSQKERRKREIAVIVKGAENEIKIPISFEAYRLFGVAVYWGEGSKHGGFSFTNSDPHLVLFMVNWFQNIFGVTQNDLVASLNIYSQQNDKELKQFWSDLTGIPLENFRKSFVKPPNKGYKKNTLYYGTIRVRVRRGTDMKHRVFGWLGAVLKDIAPAVDLMQKQWVSLKETPRPINLS